MSQRNSPSSPSVGRVERRRLAARLLTVGFSGTTLSDDLKKLLDRGVGGVILFRRNLGPYDQARDLIAQIKEYASEPVFVGTDQEGGLVQRFREGFTRYPALRAVGEIGDPDLAFRYGMALGRELREVGVDVNFAPVLDVDTNPQNPVIGNRSFGADPRRVAELGVALGRGLEAAGVASCGKHFPGHGDTSVDSHLGLPRLEHARQRLDEVELVPFVAWCKARLAAVMTAHVIFDAVDGKAPATLSHPVITGILRGDLRYDGVVFSDDLEMKAIADHFGLRTAARASIEAGVDNLLCCHSASLAEDLIDHLGSISEENDGFAGLVERAARRVERFVKTWTAARSSQASDGIRPQDVVQEVNRRGREETSETSLDPTEIMEQIKDESTSLVVPRTGRARNPNGRRGSSE